MDNLGCTSGGNSFLVAGTETPLGRLPTTAYLPSLPIVGVGVGVGSKTEYCAATS